LDNKKFNRYAQHCPKVCPAPCSKLREKPHACNEVSLAMVYSPFEPFEDLFEPGLALLKGTIFPTLDKPFFGTCDGNTIKRGLC